MKEYKCPKCNSKNLFVKKVGNNTGLYCVDCGAWIKWVGKNELRAFEYLTKQKHVDDANSKQDDIANIIYGTLDHMYYLINIHAAFERINAIMVTIHAQNHL